MQRPRQSNSESEGIMKHLSKIEIAVIKARILRGDRHYEIAADYRIPQSRLTDLKRGRLHPGIAPADLGKP